MAAFRAVTRFGDRVLAEIHHSGDLSADRIAELAGPALSSWEAGRQQAALDELDAATGKRRAAFGLEAVWAQATDAKVGRLVVEETFHQAAEQGEDRAIVSAAGPDDDPSIDDAVDELIAQVSTTGGTVSVVADGLLEQHGRIAAVLRY